MGKRRFKKHKQMREDYAQIQAAGKKRGLWGSIGATLLGGAATLATGGAAAPIVAGLMAGGGAWAGGHIGNWLAGKTKFGGSGKLTGTKWYGSVGEELGSTIKENINVQALKAGVTATTMAAGGKIGSKLLGKGGPSVTASTGTAEGTNKLGSYTKGLFKGGEKVHDYSDSLLGRLGKTIDFKGSAIGSKVGTMMHEGGWTGKDLADWGEESLATGRGVPGRRGYTAPGEITSKVKGSQIPQGGVDLDIVPRELRGRPAFDPASYIQSADVPFTGSKVTASQAQESAILQNELKNYQFGSGVEGRAEPWQEALHGGVDPNLRGLDKTHQGGVGWGQFTGDLVKTVGSNDFYSDSWKASNRYKDLFGR